MTKSTFCISSGAKRIGKTCIYTQQLITSRFILIYNVSWDYERIAFSAPARKMLSIKYHRYHYMKKGTLWPIIWPYILPLNLTIRDPRLNNTPAVINQNQRCHRSSPYSSQDSVAVFFVSPSEEDRHRSLWVHVGVLGHVEARTRPLWCREYVSQHFPWAWSW